MIKLNLLPEKVRAAERLQLIILLGAAVYVLALLGLGARWTAARAKLAGAEREVQAVKDQLNAPDLQGTVQAVEKFAHDLADVKAKASVVNQFRKDQATLVRLMDAVPEWTLGGQVWILGLETQGAKGKRKVALDANCQSRAVFARFYSALESQPLVKDLTLEQAPGATVDHGQNAFHFRVSFATEEYQ